MENDLCFIPAECQVFGVGDLFAKEKIQLLSKSNTAREKIAYLYNKDRTKVPHLCKSLVVVYTFSCPVVNRRIWGKQIELFSSEHKNTPSLTKRVQ